MCVMHEREYQLRVAQNVAAARKKRNMTQVQLADALGATRQFVGAIEKSRHSVSLRTLVRVANALDIEPYLLLKRKESS